MKIKIKMLVFFSMLLFLVACGTDDNSDQVTDVRNGSQSEDSGSVKEIDISANNWSFDQETYTVDAGEITINLTNKEGYHGIKIDGTDVAIDGDGSITTNLDPGEYQITCSIPCGAGHDDMGATLVVK